MIYKTRSYHIRIEFNTITLFCEYYSHNAILCLFVDFQSCLTNTFNDIKVQDIYLLKHVNNEIELKKIINEVSCTFTISR